MRQRLRRIPARARRNAVFPVLLPHGRGAGVRAHGAEKVVLAVEKVMVVVGAGKVAKTRHSESEHQVKKLKGKWEKR